MKNLVICLVFSVATFHLVSGLHCYSCRDSNEKCSDIQTCTYEDACLSFAEKGGMTIHQCIRYTDCNIVRIKQMFAKTSTFTFQCCTNNLCNSSTATAVSKLLLGLLASLVLLCCCLL